MMNKEKDMTETDRKEILELVARLDRKLDEILSRLKYLWR
jgi:hypothetical protein